MPNYTPRKRREAKLIACPTYFKRFCHPQRQWTENIHTFCGLISVIFLKRPVFNNPVESAANNGYSRFSNFCCFLLVVAGDFLRPNEPINITMGQNQPFLLRCPPRAYSYRVTYDWIVQSSQISIANNPLFAPRILMEPSGDLLFSFVDASQLDPVQCRITDLFGRRRSVGPPMYLLDTIPGTNWPIFSILTVSCSIILTFIKISLLLIPIIEMIHLKTFLLRHSALDNVLR